MLLLTIVLCVFGASSAAKTGNRDLLTELADNGQFTKITDLIGQSLPGLLSNLSALPEATLFLPTDAAMSRVPDSVINGLKSDTQKLTDFILYHVVSNDTIRIRSMMNDKEYMAMSGKPLRINTFRYGDGNKFQTAEGINITLENIAYDKGFVHGIDGLMTPPAGSLVYIMSQNPDLTKFSSLLSKAGLVDLINADRNITVFAPSDAAFAGLPANVMQYLENHPDQLKEFILYHFVDKTTMYSIGMKHGMTFTSSDGHRDRLMLLEDYAGNVYLNRAKLVAKDISATNGVLHVIDDVLIPTNVLLNMESAGLSVVG